MKILLDTHVFLWLQTEPERLGDELAIVEDTSTELLLSAASAWEIAVKSGIGRLALPEPATSYVPTRMRTSAVTELPVTHEHALTVASLPQPEEHKDPFDRLLIATAQVDSLPILTYDPSYELYDVELVRPRPRRRRRRR